MIKILIVEDNLHKRDNIKKVILENTNIEENDLLIVDCVKSAKALLYKEYLV